MAKVSKRGRKAPPRVRRSPVAPRRPSGERLELAMRAINEGVYDWDVADRRIHYSQGVYSVLKMPRNMKTPADWRKRIHPDDRAAYDAAIVAHFKQQTKRFECDYRFRATDGTWHWARQRGIALRDPRGRAVRMTGSIGDISDLKQAEEARRQSDERYAFAMRAINEGVYDWNLAEGRTYYSERVVNALGLTQKQLRTAADWHKRIHPEDCPRFDAALVAHFKGDTERFECDYRYRARDGSWRWARQHGIAMRDARGRAVRMIGSTGDINELKLAEIELRRARDEATEALERQTATAEILRVIGGSMTDTQPVFDAIVKNCGSLFKGSRVVLWLIGEDRLHPRASNGKFSGESMPIDRESVIGVCVLDGGMIHLPDLEKAAEQYPRIRQLGLKFGYHSGIYAPLLRAGRAIGGISVLRRETGAFDDKEVTLLNTFADQAVIAIENVRLFDETKEALERQTATAEILKVIASSPSDVQPVFDAIARSANQLIEGFSTAVARLFDDALHLVAYTTTNEAGDELLKSAFPIPVSSSNVIIKVVRTGVPVCVTDTETDSEVSSAMREVARVRGYRSMLIVPLLREHAATGFISVTRREPGEFGGHQINLLKTFADQAVIAIENVRLFNETKEALERQTATGEILKVIASSPSDVQPVFDAIVASAVSLFGRRAIVRTLTEDGQLLLRAHRSVSAGDDVGAVPSLPLDRDSTAGRAILERKALQVADLKSPDAPPFALARSDKLGYRSIAAAPLISEGKAIGVIAVTATEPGALSHKQLDLLQSFADQAVIAIQNVRLFNETKEALERQTATAEILRVISSTPTDTQPVFDAIVDSTQRLIPGKSTHLLLRREMQFVLAGYSGPEMENLNDQVRTAPLDRDKNFPSRAILDGEVVHVTDWEGDDVPEFEKVVGKVYGIKSGLIVPLLREGEGIGAIAVAREVAGPYHEKEISLLRSFADQAVIAIENVRLFNETREALERQTATAEILKVIAGSPTDVQPVFDVIVESAVRLCGARFGRVYRYDGSVIQMVAGHGLSTNGLAQVQRVFPRPAADDTIVGRVILTRRPFYVRDIEREETVPALSRQMIEALGTRSQVTIPMLRAGEPIGAITMGWDEREAFDDQQVALLQTFADQAVIAIENVRLFNETKESLERQTATSEILRVISESPTDVTPVFETILSNAARLCDSKLSAIFRFDGEFLHLAATRNWSEEALAEVGRKYPMAPDRSMISGRAILTKSVVRVADTHDDSEYSRNSAAAGGWRRMLAVPMLREGEPIGAFVVAWPEPGETPEHHVQLLQTFADQAVIAIENVRLFNETKESLEQQTAISEILRVISNSPGDVQPVLDAVAERAARICAAQVADIVLVEGETLRIAASIGDISRPGVAERVPLDRATVMGRSIVDRATVHVADLQDAPESEFARGRMLALKHGHRTILAVPLLREDRVLGTILLRRTEVRPFDDKHIALLRTFADQAAIAIENVRLFNETKEALERQTATAEILKVISSSPTDTQPVFDVIAKSGMRLFDGLNVAILLRQESQFVLAGYSGLGKEDLPDHVRTAPLDREKNFPSRVILDGEVLHITDWEGDDVPEFEKFVAKSFGIRSGLLVPLLRKGEGIGAIVVARAVAGPFHEKDVALLQSFADQAVIAIENVRLFNETKEALERQTATAEILRVIASSPSDVQPVFDAIAASARRLINGRYAVVATRVADSLHLAALTGTTEEGDAALRKLFPTPITGQGAMGKAVISRNPVPVEDIEADPAYSESFRQGARARGMRSMLCVPMLREAEAIGVITVNRAESGQFTEHQVNLLKAFADQAVIAIENVRLFNETKEALERQTATSEILRVISSSTTDLQPVFDAILGRAVALCGAHLGNMFQYDGAMLEMVASNLPSPAIDILRRDYPAPASREKVSGRVVLSRQVVEIPDIRDDAEYRGTAPKIGGYRSLLGVPLLREGQPIGAIVIARPEPGKFTPKQIAMVQTFADQAVIAIENVRLFKDLEARTQALTKSVGQLTALGEVGQAISSTLDLETVLRTIVSRAVQLSGLDGGSIYEYDERAEEFRLQAAENMGQDIAEDIRKTPTRKGDGVLGRTAITLEPTQVPDTLDEGYQSGRKELLVRAGYRALLAVPLLREGHLLGALLVNRKTPGPFAPEVVELLKTFATQSAMAIQNARLFREIAEKGKQLEVASRHKSDFLASMSHELRTPLNAILGFNEMIIGQVYGEVPADMQEPLNDIQTSGKHLLRLINNVLDLAKIEAGRMELSLQDYSVHDTVESVRSTLRPLAAEKGLEFLATVPQDVPLSYGDPGRIAQCLMNLAGNSLKFTKAGKVEISVETRGDLLVYKVADTGIGIAPDKLETVFAEFKQTDATIASEYGGTGLGLSISRKFVEMHGGRIWVESELGKGSAFIFEVPLRAKTT